MPKRKRLPDDLTMTKVNDGPMDKHRSFIKWAKEHCSIEVLGIEPATLDGKGTGIIASKALKKGDILLRAPTMFLINANTPFIRETKLRDGTVHGLIATELTRNHGDPRHAQAFAPWIAVWPSPEELKTAMPLLWTAEWQALLPPPAQVYLAKQQARFDRDWNTSSSILPDSTFELFQYYWLIVNTRCFHWPFNRWPPPSSKSGRKRRRTPNAKLSTDDQMALCPVADYFNHTSNPQSIGASFEATKDACVVTAERDFEKGEEVLFCYGSHDGDYLLVEYGFCLSGEWEHDCVRLDEAVVPRLRDEQKALLEEYGYRDNFTLSMSGGVDWRTTAAINVLAYKEDLEKARQVLLGQDEGVEKGILHESTSKLARTCKARANAMIAELENMDECPQRRILLLRYRQMVELLGQPIDFWEEEVARSRENVA